MATTRIEWADRVWNPVTGCSKCSPACDNCYAERMSKRLAGRCGYPTLDPFKVTSHADKLNEPLRWKKHARAFVGSMTDLFHEDVPDVWRDQVFATMALADPAHTFMLLTKREERMAEYLNFEYRRERIFKASGQSNAFCLDWPLPHVWMGATIWDQPSLDRALPILLRTPAALRFLSTEPMLGPVSIPPDMLKLLGWVICGGETGPGARPMHPDWPRSLRDQCQAAGVPFFYKQHGAWAEVWSGTGLPGDVWLTGDGVSTQPWTTGSAGAPAGKWGQFRDVLMRRAPRGAKGRRLDGQEWSEVPA